MTDAFSKLGPPRIDGAKLLEAAKPWKGEEPQVRPSTTTLTELLDDVRAFIRRFVVLTDAQADAVTLWAAHTYVFDAFGCTAYLAITSPEKRSGKTRLLEVLELIVREALPTANISDAALFRVVDEHSPSLLIDEVDGIFGKKSREREELRGILNAGYRRGAVVHRMGGSNNTKLQTFSVYCPKAFAGIGDCLPDTVSDRAISIRLKRRTKTEPIERFRLRDVQPEGHGLCDQLAAWFEPQYEALAASRPALPEDLDDRAQDVWEPLFAIADLAGGDWPERARCAALTLSSGDEREDDSVTVLLLRDIRDVFNANGCDAFKTADLLEHLHAIEESPWGEWYGKQLSAHGLSALLKPYRIRTMTIYLGAGESGRGYKVEQFADAFARVLGVQSDRSDRSGRSKSTSHAASNASTASNASPAEGKAFAPGDEGFLAALDEAFLAGHLTLSERRSRVDLHRLIVEAV